MCQCATVAMCHRHTRGGWWRRAVRAKGWSHWILLLSQAHTQDRYPAAAGVGDPLMSGLLHVGIAKAPPWPQGPKGQGPKCASAAGNSKSPNLTKNGREMDAIHPF